MASWRRRSTGLAPSRSGASWRRPAGDTPFTLPLPERPRQSPTARRPETVARTHREARSVFAGNGPGATSAPTKYARHSGGADTHHIGSGGRTTGPFDPYPGSHIYVDSRRSSGHAGGTGGRPISATRRTCLRKDSRKPGMTHAAPAAGRGNPGDHALSPEQLRGSQWPSAGRGPLPCRDIRSPAPGAASLRGARGCRPGA